MAVRLVIPLIRRRKLILFDRASPRLKDADIPADRIRDLYVELLVILRTMFARCKLVHADFSEYNILLVLSHPFSGIETNMAMCVDSTKVIYGLSTSHNP